MSRRISKVNATPTMLGVDLVRLLHLRVGPVLNVQVTHPGINRVETFIVHPERVMLKKARDIGPFSDEEAKIQGIPKYDAPSGSIPAPFNADALKVRRHG